MNKIYAANFFFICFCFVFSLSKLHKKNSSTKFEVYNTKWVIIKCSPMPTKYFSFMKNRWCNTCLTNLANLIKSHDNHCSSMSLDCMCFLQEVFLSFFETYAVYYTFPLRTLQASFYYLKLGWVYAQRNLGKK